MSENNLYEEKNKIPYFNKNINNLKNSYENPINYYSYPNLPNCNIIDSKIINTKNNEQNENMPFDNNYIRGRYSKIKEENSCLKQKLFELEKDYKIQKGEMEEKILVLRDENSNLQIQLQKSIEKQKKILTDMDNIYNENKSLLNTIDQLNNDLNNLKDNITRKNADIEEKNKIINDLLKEKSILLNESKMMKSQIGGLISDKEILINQIQDLNNTIGEKIAPKLKQNESNLIILQEQIENLRINNEKFKSDNTLLFNENKIQKNLLKILTKQNKKLLGEIRIIYDRDILLMDNMEKMGINNKENYKKLFDNNQELFEEEMNILKQSQKYIGEEEENELNNLDYKNNNMNNFGINDMDNINKSEIYVKNNFINNKDELNEKNSIINNEIIVKRNKQSIENENEYKNINRNNNKSLCNDNLRDDDILNDKLSIQNKNDLINEKINKKIGKNNLKEKKINEIKNNNIKNNQIQSYTMDINNKHSKIKFEDIEDDIKLQNDKLFNSDDKFFNEKNRNTNNYFYRNYNSNDIINDQCMYSTDGKINIKANNMEIENISQNNRKDNYEKNVNNQISKNSNDNSMLLNSQAKSILSEYVEDLDVIKDKDDNI